MTLMNRQNHSLKTITDSHKSAGFTMKDFSAPQHNTESRQDDARMQSSNKRRRYQRRGSKVPSMLMGAFTACPRLNDGTTLLEIQRKILQDKEFLLSLKLSSSETHESSRTKVMKRKTSLDLFSNSPFASERSELRRIPSSDKASRAV